MKANKLFLSLLGVFVFAGCTGFNQDPLKDKSDSIRGAVDPSTKPDFIKALPPGSYSVVQPETSMVFKVGKTTTYPISLKTYSPDYSYNLEITNLASFAGASFDAAGNFTWNPPASTISSKTYEGFDAIVRISAVSKIGGIVLESYDKVRIWVETDVTALPSIKSVKFSSIANPLMFEEGTSRDVTIYAEDVDGQDAPGMRPTLVFSGKLAQYVTVRSTRYLAASNQWEFEVRADLSNADVTKNLDSAPLLVQVSNRLSKVSVPNTIGFTVLSKLSAPLSTFDNTTTLNMGLPNKVAFSIYDSAEESIVALSNTSNLPVGATINCERSVRKFQQCRLEWTPSTMGSYTTILEIETRSSSPVDTRPAVKNTIAIAYKVQ